MTKKIYLCGPINGRSDDDCKNWREWFKKQATFQYIDPMRRDYRGKETELICEIVLLDKLDIQQSDALIVYYDKPSVGTSMEVFYADSLKKPIVLINASGDENLSPWLIYHATIIVTDPQAAYQTLRRWFIC
jgi:nucleoside 2-deoxyribosyltransferase